MSAAGSTTFRGRSRSRSRCRPRGSSHHQPVAIIATPATATPSASSASEARCTKALRTFRSLFPIAQEERGRHTVDEHADERDRDDALADHDRRRRETTRRLADDTARHEQQDERVRERREDRRAAKSVRSLRRRRATCESRRTEREGEPEHVTEVVPGVRDEGHRMRDEAVDRLENHESKVQPDADDERPDPPRARANARGECA